MKKIAIIALALTALVTSCQQQQQQEENLAPIPVLPLKK